MGVSALARRLYHVTIWRLLIVGVFIAVMVAFQGYWSKYSLLDADRSSIALPVEVFSAATAAKDVSKEHAYEKESDLDLDLESDGGKNSRKGEILSKSFKEENHEDAIYSFTQKRPKFEHDPALEDREKDNRHNVPYPLNSIQFTSQGVSSKGIKILDSDLSNTDLLLTVKQISNGSGILNVENEKPQLLKTPLSILNNKSEMGASSVRNKLVRPTSITRMNSLLLNSFNSSFMRPRWSSRRDSELLSAKAEIENARIISNSSELYAPIFRDVSKFSRSYELMEHKLKVYIYREGEKPIFHQPKMRGLYASEGWFMKLMEGNKRFVVKDPRKAHLFYLPFSSQMLRVTLSDNKLMEQYLERYVNLIAGRYRFWNRTGGADHFLVACHDWADRITRQPMKSCIRSLCNANVAKGFQIGKDTTLPVTYIHSAMDPLTTIARKPPSERSILAFFAGGMHGYLRPVLLKHWENKEPDMKIFGQMPRDVEGKKIYMEYMNSSRYCICARGYEVHSPRIVEAIFSECVPVIISDNYVPPFFEVLKWEAFSVIVRENDIPSLRSILLSIPEEKYLALHLGVKKARQHFLWNKVAIKQLKAKEGYIKGDITLHISPKLFFTHDLQRNGDMDIQQIRSSDNLADLFTMALPTTTFEKLAQNIGVRRLKDLN